MSVTRIRYQAPFCAAVRLWREDWSEARNHEVYGVCASPHGHGHDYLLTVEVVGTPDLETGMVVDYMVLKRLIEERFLRHVDHRNLNVDVPFLRGVVPTSENILAAAWPLLAGGLPDGVRLHALHLQEGRDCSCSYYGTEDE